MPPWQPGPFEAYREHFPATPPLRLPPPGPSVAFAEAFAALADPAHPTSQRVQAALRGAEVVLIRGYLGNWMPGNFSEVCRSLRSVGARAWIMRSSARAGVAENAARLADRLAQRPGDGPLWLLGHSKGGLEALTAARDPRIAPRLRAVITAQTARGPSPVVESLILRRHQASLRGLRRRLAEALQRLGLGLIGARAGGLALTAEAMAGAVAPLDAAFAAGPGVPHLHAASWSLHPTAWLDAFHERLGEIAPGVAHDGQFFLEDLLWPGRPTVLLAEVDHAQPAMGGHGLDAARLWQALVAVALDL